MRKHEYTVADWARRDERRRERNHRLVEDDIIKEVERRNKLLDTAIYHPATKEKKKMLKAQANTIPLKAWGVQ